MAEVLESRVYRRDPRFHSRQHTPYEGRRAWEAGKIRVDTAYIVGDRLLMDDDTCL